MLEQPIATILQSSRKILLAGCGGGYDVLGAVPLAYELVQSGKEVAFANLSFTRLDHLMGHRAAVSVPHLYSVDASAVTEEAYCPEAWLAAWLASTGDHKGLIWCFENVGVVPLRTAYEYLVHTLEIDTIVLIDGGVDSLLRGDETSLGTPAEDLASIAAVEGLRVPRKILACVGFGSEIRDGICHAQVLERVTELSAEDGLLGMWPLLSKAEAARRYLDAYAFVSSHQSRQHGSHIHSVIAQSMHGNFGARGNEVWLSPLAPIYWFFSLPVVARTHLLLNHIHETKTLWEIAAIVEAVRKRLHLKERCSIPL